MFPQRFYPRRFYAARYWPKAGGSAPSRVGPTQLRAAVAQRGPNGGTLTPTGPSGGTFAQTGPRGGTYGAA